MLRYFAKATAVVCLLLQPTLATALTPAFSPAGGLESNSRGAYIGRTSGINFAPESDIIVEALGVYDAGTDGLRDAWQAALYDVASQQMLRLADIPAGASATTKVGHFRYVPVSPIRLTEGVVYQVAAYNFGKGGNLSGQLGQLNFTVGASPDIHVIGSARGIAINNGKVTFAPFAFGPYSIGGGFLYRVIPEPTALALAAMLAGCVMMGRRRG